MRIAATAGVVALDARGRLLLVQRADGLWALPGGHLEPGETWRACAQREFSEETGLEVEITGLLGLYSDPTTQKHRRLDGEVEHFVGVVFEGVTEGEPSAPRDDEIVKARFFDRSELPTRLFAPDRPVLEDAFSDVRRPVLS